MHSILLISIVYFTGCWARKDVKGPWVRITTYLKVLLQRRQSILLSIPTGKRILSHRYLYPKLLNQRYTCKHSAMTWSWVQLFTSILLALLGSRKRARGGSCDGCQQSENWGLFELSWQDKVWWGRKSSAVQRWSVRSSYDPISLPLTCT